MSLEARARPSSRDADHAMLMGKDFKLGVGGNGVKALKRNRFSAILH